MGNDRLDFTGWLDGKKDSIRILSGGSDTITLEPKFKPIEIPVETPQIVSQIDADARSEVSPKISTKRSQEKNDGLLVYLSYVLITSGFVLIIAYYRKRAKLSQSV